VTESSSRRTAGARVSVAARPRAPKINHLVLSLRKGVEKGKWPGTGEG
jgi:hypothetical protein